MEIKATTLNRGGGGGVGKEPNDLASLRKRRLLLKMLIREQKTSFNNFSQTVLSGIVLIQELMFLRSRSRK